MGVSMKYGFGLYREIKDIRQKIDGGLTKYVFPIWYQKGARRIKCVVIARFKPDDK